MNGLLVNSYQRPSKPVKPEPVVDKSPSFCYYHTWPRRRKSSKKKIISQIIHQLKREHALSEIHLNLQTSNNLVYPEFLPEKQVGKNVDKESPKPLTEDDVENKNELNGCDEKSEKSASRTISHQCTTSKDDLSLSYEKNLHCITSNGDVDDDLFNENTLGIIKILKE